MAVGLRPRATRLPLNRTPHIGLGRLGDDFTVG
jgi:hypothetical protein